MTLCYHSLIPLLSAVGRRDNSGFPEGEASAKRSGPGEVPGPLQDSAFQERVQSKSSRKRRPRGFFLGALPLFMTTTIPAIKAKTPSAAIPAPMITLALRPESLSSLDLELELDEEPFELAEDGLSHSVKIGDAIDFEIEDIVPFGVETGEPVRLVGVFHPASSEFNAAEAKRSKIGAFGIEYEGKTGISASEFAWAA